MSLNQPNTPVQTRKDVDFAAPAQRKTLTLWSNVDFMKFWTGETISLFGTQVTLLALPLTAVLELSVSSEQLGLLRFLESFPYILLPLLFGAWVDRRRKRPLMIMTNATRALLIGLIPLLAIFHLLSLTPLYLIAFCIGVFTVLFDLCWLSFVPALVPKEHLIEANSRVGTSSAAAEVCGPGLGGLLVQLLSAPLALLADSCSYVISVISLLLIRHPEPQPEKAADAHLLKEIGEGLGFMWNNPYIRTLALQAGAWNFCDGIVEVVFLLYAVRQLGFSAGVIGTIYAIGAVGGLLGATIAGPLARRFPLGPVICATFTLGSTPFILLPLLAGPQLVVAVGSTIVFFLVRTALGIYFVQSISLRQAVTPTALMARMNATLRLISYSGVSLGPLTAGFLGTWLGLRPSLWVAGIGFIVALVPIFFSPIRRLRGFPSAA